MKFSLCLVNLDGEQFRGARRLFIGGYVSVFRMISPQQ